MKVLVRLIILVFLFSGLKVSGQVMAINSSINSEESVKEVKQFSNSESPHYIFAINTNVKNNEIKIETNYSGTYKVRFLDYYGKSIKVYRDVSADKLIDVAELRKGIYIMNITDARSHKLLTSQVVNLKKRHL